MRFVAQEEEPVAGLEVVSLAAGREGDPPVEAIDRDRALDLVRDIS
jgi:hypothetical protein